MRASILACAALLLTASCATTPADAPTAAFISIEAPAKADWSVTYTLPSPATELVFARSTDASRTTDWKAPAGFEIVQVGEAELVRRHDGAVFSAVTVDMPPLYRPLPSDYAPFSPFGDGGLLAYSGRFFACGDACADDAAWRLRLHAPGRTILLDGASHAGGAEWIDRDSGRNVFLGDNKPVETADFIAIIDTTLPGEIRTQLSAQLPLFMHYFAERLGALSDRPMLFASYDLSHSQGSGRQGGTLPGQVFVHFYGPVWPERMAQPGFAADLAWHFAHEAAHLYQHQIFTDGDDAAWIHEGGAEAFAAIALRQQGQGAEADANVAASAEQCRSKLGARSIHAALVEGDYDVAYVCGVQVNLALDAELRRAAPASDGLFSVWRRYREQVSERTPTEEDFLAAIAFVGDAGIAARVREMLDTPSPAFSFAPAGGGGANGQW